MSVQGLSDPMAVGPKYEGLDAYRAEMDAKRLDADGQPRSLTGEDRLGVQPTMTSATFGLPT